MAYFNHTLGKTYYHKKGSKSKYPLITLHGGPGGNHHSLYPILDLYEKRKVVLFDQIGSGLSSPLATKDMKIKTFVDNLQGLLDHLEIEEFHLLGSSWGTTLALEYYLQKKPKGLKSITFQSPMFSAALWEKDAQKLIRSLPKEKQKIIRYCHEIGATDSKVYKEAVTYYYRKHVFRLKKRPESLPAKTPNPHGNRLYSHMWGPSEFCATGTLKNYDKLHRLKDLKVPTLFLYGEHDEVSTGTINKFVKSIPDARARMIKGASHSVFIEKTKPSLKALDQFLQGVEKERED